MPLSLLGLLVFGFSNAQAQYVAPTAKDFIRVQMVNKLGAAIKWDKATYQAKAIQDDQGEPILQVDVGGEIVEKDISLLLDYRPLKVAPNGAFRFVVNLRQAVTQIHFLQVLPNGKINYNFAIVNVVVLDWMKSQALLKDSPRKAWSTVVGLGVTSLTYSQTHSTIGQLSSITTTGKLGIDYRPPHTKWVYGFFGFMNLLDISKKDPAREFRFIGLNLRAGRVIPVFNFPWEFSMHGGYYFITMQTNGKFGFSNLQGPQVYPAIRYQLAGGSVIAGYAKYSPVTDGFKIMNLNNYEVAAGVAFIINSGKLRKAISLDLSTIKINTTDNFNQITTAKSTSMTLGGTVYF